MSGTETINEETEDGRYTGSAPVTGRPTKALFSLMEDEAGGATPEPTDLGDYNQEFIYSELNPKDYHSSNFPSLLSQLGPRERHKTKRKRKKKQNRQFHSTEDEHDDGNERSRRHKEQLSFAEQMRRHNEAQWMRIEAVAKEKMDYYDKYVSDMTLKLKQQRMKINQRAEQLLKSLEKQEEKKKEDRLFDSSYGRIWRHHRSMQRRAYSLEPMRPHKITCLRKIDGPTQLVHGIIPKWDGRLGVFLEVTIMTYTRMLLKEPCEKLTNPQGAKY